MDLIAKHKRFTAWYKKKLGLSDYGLIWFRFIDGIIVGLIIERLIVHHLMK